MDSNGNTTDTTKQFHEVQKESLDIQPISKKRVVNGGSNRSVKQANINDWLGGPTNSKNGLIGQKRHKCESNEVSEIAIDRNGDSRVH